MALNRFVAMSTALGLGLALALGVPAATPGSAGAAPRGENLARLCKLILANPSPEDAVLTQGGCVAFLAAGNNTPILANVCRMSEGVAVAEAISGRENLNHGQCVGVLKDFAAEP